MRLLPASHVALTTFAHPYPPAPFSTGGEGGTLCPLLAGRDPGVGSYAAHYASRAKFVTRH